MKNIKELLTNLDACYDARQWAETLDFDWIRIYNECERGDWLLWLHFKTNQSCLRKRTLVKGLIAKTVEHLMTYQRSKDAVKAAIDYGNGLINDEELAAAAADAASASAAAYAAAAAAAAAADAASASAAAYAADAAAADAAYAAAADAASASAAAAKKESLKSSANIFRSIIPSEDFKI